MCTAFLVASIKKGGERIAVCFIFFYVNQLFFMVESVLPIMKLDIRVPSSVGVKPSHKSIKQDVCPRKQFVDHR